MILANPKFWLLLPFLRPRAGDTRVKESLAKKLGALDLARRAWAPTKQALNKFYGQDRVEKPFILIGKTKKKSGDSI
jgi:hypothetical protein